MTLSFSQSFDGKPNYFAEKIIKSLPMEDHKKWTLLDLLGEVNNPSEQEFHAGSCNPYHMEECLKPKLHTIRRDEHDRWKEGMMIHPVINNRTSERFQFAPDMKCTGIQEIVLKWQPDGYDVGSVLNVWIDGRPLDNLEKFTLALNDGFETFVEFGEYFNADFKGKLIHWTDKRY